MKQGQNVNQQFQLIKLAGHKRLNERPAYQEFFKILGSLAQEPVLDYILKKYSQFNSQKFSKMINDMKVIDIILKRNTGSKISGWQMPDYIALIWLASKVLELNQKNGSVSFQFDDQDYNLMDKVMNCQNGQAFGILQTFKQNPYTDKWFKQQFTLLSQIFQQQQKKGQISWQNIAFELQKINRSLYSMYRCPYQCQKKLKYTRSYYRQWSQEEDRKLLKIAQQTQNFQPNWIYFKRYFQGRSDVALRARLKILLSRLRLANPFPYQMTDGQLIKKFNKGQIDLSKSNSSDYVVKKSQKTALHQQIRHLKSLIDKTSANKYKTYAQKRVQPYQKETQKQSLNIQRKKKWDTFIKQFEKQVVLIKKAVKDFRRQHQLEHQASLIKKLKKIEAGKSRKIQNLQDFSEDQSYSSSLCSQNSYSEQDDVIYYD